jgi:hypothetical protein
MAYENFIPEVWADHIEKELERVHVFVSGTNRSYEGEVRRQGDTIHILGIGKPTITRTENKSIVLGDPEVVEDTAATLIVDQIAHFNYMVEDIDKAQAVGGIMEALSSETTEGLADEMDRYVAGMAGWKGVQVDAAAPYTVDVDNVYAKIDAALQLLWENDVKPSTKIEMIIPPKFYNIMKQAQIKIDTDNSDVIQNGRIGRYGGVQIKMSNNVLGSNAAGHKIMVRTERAIAFVNPLVHTEAYRPEKRFSDAVKGFILFAGKPVRPKEMIIMNVKYS